MVSRHPRRLVELEPAQCLRRGRNVARQELGARVALAAERSRARARSRDGRSSDRDSVASTRQCTSRVRFEVSTTTGGMSARTTPSSGTEIDQSERISSRNALELVVGAIDLVDQQHRRPTAPSLREGPQQRTLHEEALGVELCPRRHASWPRLDPRGGAGAAVSSSHSYTACDASMPS